MGAELTWQAQTAAKILAARQRKGRMSHKKSRSGCLACTTRRIKCDEGRPNCHNCLKSSSSCEYGQPPPQDQNSISHSLVGAQLASVLGLQGDAERRTFDYFLSWTAPRLAGTLDKDFWCGQVLQLAQSEPFILDALLAISELYEHPKFMKSFHAAKAISAASPEQERKVASLKDSAGIVHPAFSRPPIDVHHASALKHYNRAIASVRKRVESNSTTLLMALLSCILFICIEVIRDNVFGTMALFAHGTKLLKQIEDNVADVNSELFGTLKLMLERLATLAGVVGKPVPSALVLGQDISPEHKMFSNMSDARNALLTLMAQCHGLNDDADGSAGEHIHAMSPSNSYRAMVSSDGYLSTSLYDPNVVDEMDLRAGGEAEGGTVNGSFEATTQEHAPAMTQAPSIPQNLVERSGQLQNRLLDWRQKLLAIENTDIQTAASLLTHYEATRLWLSTRLAGGEMVFDECTHDFLEILRYAELCLTSRGERSTFTFEIGVVPPLYLVATKCRVPSIRRKAIDLMHKAPRKESIWGSDSTAEFAERVIPIEEERLQDQPRLNQNTASTPSDTVLPAASERIHALEIVLNDFAGRFDARVTRYSYDPVTQCHMKPVDDYPI